MMTSAEILEHLENLEQELKDYANLVARIRNELYVRPNALKEKPVFAFINEAFSEYYGVKGKVIKDGLIEYPKIFIKTQDWMMDGWELKERKDDRDE